jgi:AcrR family transcriptional regulator
MTHSATSRDARRATTAHRITACAQRLADERGLEGFTLEDLAEAAAVSRRTLFNYVPGKLDAVLGPVPVLPAEPLDTFRAGGPHHDLVEDLAVLAHPMLAGEAVGREEVARHRRLLRANPRLLAAAHERFETLSAQLVAEILRREGPAFDTHRARVAVRVLVALFDVSLDAFLTELGEHELADLFIDSLRTARELLA